MYYNEYEEERLYSTGSDELDDLMTKAFCEGYNDFYQKNFGVASKVGAYFSPGGWNAKELAKLEADNEKDYEDHKIKNYIKGTFAPGTATYKLHKAQELAAKGASPAEIRKKVGNIGAKHLIGEIAAGTLTGGAYTGLAHTAAIVKGAQTKLDEDEKGMRRKFHKN